jgi:hypothetical protein
VPKRATSPKWQAREVNYPTNALFPKKRQWVFRQIPRAQRRNISTFQVSGEWQPSRYKQQVFLRRR